MLHAVKVSRRRVQSAARMVSGAIIIIAYYLIISLTISPLSIVEQVAIFFMIFAVQHTIMY
jgi:hypothetical protein